MWSAYARRNIAWREQQQRSQQASQPRQNSLGGRTATVGADATGEGTSKQHATDSTAAGRPSNHHHSSAATKKKSATSGASSKAGRGRNDGAAGGGQQRGVHVQPRAQPRSNARPPSNAHPSWNATVGGAAAAGSTITLPLTINLNMTQGEASQLTNDSVLLSCCTTAAGGGATGSKENEPFEENVPLGQKSPSTGSHETHSSNWHKKAFPNDSRVPLGQKSLSSGSQATTQHRPQRVCLPTAILHPALGGGPSEYARRKMEGRLEKEKKEEEEEEEEASGQVSLWKRAQQEDEADGTFLAPTSSPYRPPFLHFDPKQRVYPHVNRWKREPLPALAQPVVAQPQRLLAAQDDNVDKQQIDQACWTHETDLGEASDELKAEASRARKELEAEAKAALENQRQQFDKQLQEVQRLLQDARETGHTLRDDLRNEHSKAKASLKKVLDHGLSIANDAFRSKLTDIKNELLKDILPFTEKYCGKWLAMFRTQEKRKEEVAEPAGEKRRNVSATASSAIVHPTPCDRKSTRGFSGTPCIAMATEEGSDTPNAGDVHSKPSEPEDATKKPSSRQSASTVKSRKQPNSSPKTVSSRSLTPAQHRAIPKAAPVKRSTHGQKTGKNHPGSKTEVLNPPNRPTRAKTVAKTHPTLTPLRITTRNGTKKNTPVQPPANTPIRPSQKSGPAKRPREMVAVADLPPPKKRLTCRPRGVLIFSPSDDASAAFL